MLQKNLSIREESIYVAEESINRKVDEVNNLSFSQDQ